MLDQSAVFGYGVPYSSREAAIDSLLQNALAALERAGWRVERAAERRTLPAEISKRYPDIPALAVEFIEQVDRCVRGDEACWFLAAADFSGTAADSAYAWDEWERMGLEDAGEGYAKEVRDFWNRHLPILLSVEGDYLFLAIDVDKSSKTFGSVVEAEALGFEDTGVRAASFGQLLKDIVACVDDPGFDCDIGLHLLTPEQYEERRPAREKALAGKSLLGRLFKKPK
jgi:hypothetical protein